MKIWVGVLSPSMMERITFEPAEEANYPFSGVDLIMEKFDFLP